jgi:hypothetical protein
LQGVRAGKIGEKYMIFGSISFDNHPPPVKLKGGWIIGESKKKE